MEIPLDAIVGGLIGGLFGWGGAALSAYWGPRKLEEWRAKVAEHRLHGPRKALMKAMLEDPSYEWRKLSTLSQVTGTTAIECRRLLVELGARASSGKSNENTEELWALISRQPISDQ